jgi:hypothetical protein
MQINTRIDQILRKELFGGIFHPRVSVAIKKARQVLGNFLVDKVDYLRGALGPNFFREFAIRRRVHRTRPRRGDSQDIHCQHIGLP